MLEITKAAVDSTDIPVTVKTRLGWDSNSKNIVEIAERLQDGGIQALTIHGRTRNQLYKGEADWTLIGEVKNNPRMSIPIIGNGDIDSPYKAKQYLNKYGVDGIMIGRAAIGNPWIFREVRHYLSDNTILEPPSISDRVTIVKKHLYESIKWKGEKVGILEMRKHYTNYFKGFRNIKKYRAKLVTLETFEELCSVLGEIEVQYG